MDRPTYNPSYFVTNDLEMAKQLTVGDVLFEDKQVILAADRWEKETKYTLDFISEKLKLTADSVVVDYGCGTGRIAKGLIERYGCKVIGIDASESMGKIAVDYVNSDRFEFIATKDLWSHGKLEVDFVVSVFVLQHCYDPNEVLLTIKKMLKVDGKFLIINEVTRMVPTVEKPWVNDQIDIEKLTSKIFGEGSKGRLDPAHMTQKFSERTYWAVYTKTTDKPLAAPTVDASGTKTTLYNPHIFDVHSFEEAKNIILQPVEEYDSDMRWEVETEFTIGLLERLNLTPDSVVLDYGCGVGRVAKEIILNFGCWVVGVDISVSMRTFASTYVNSPKFIACSPEALDALGIKSDAAISVWVLQHCASPKNDIARIKKSLKNNGDFFVMNSKYRHIPTTDGVWVDDFVSIAELLANELSPGDYGYVPEEVNRYLAQDSYWRFFKKYE